MATSNQFMIFTIAKWMSKEMQKNI